MKKITQNDRQCVYTGDIKITISKDNIVLKQIDIHNEGLAPLFKYMALALAGSLDPLNRPMYLRIFSDKEYKYDILGFGIGYRSTPVIGVQSAPNAMASVTFQFLIPETLAVGATIKGVQLTNAYTSESESNKIIYAQANNEAAEIVQAGTNIALEWKLTIANPTA